MASLPMVRNTPWEFLKMNQIAILVANIAADFSELAHPGRDKIADDSQGYVSLEAAQVQQFFGDHKWSEMTSELLSTYKGDENSCLYFMNYPAVAYFFPAFMIIVLMDERNESGLLQTIVRLTDRSGLNVNRFDFMQRAYSERQKKLVGEFLLTVDERFNRLFGSFEGFGDKPLTIYRKHWSTFIDN